MAVTRFDHLVLTVADIQQTASWYVAVAQMRHVTFGDDRHALVFGQQKINLHERGRELEPRAAAPTPGSGDLCLIVDESPTALERRLASLAVTVELGPVARDGALGEITSFYLRDPDGNLVELASYRDGA
jgi:catechol 2,3-dioxygenase-like lactoylglutathione lyase family enzyme